MSSSEHPARPLEYLQALFGRYGDLPREVIIKEDLLTKGISWQVPGHLPPRVLQLEGGLFGLRRTIVRLDEREEAPYAVVAEGETWVLKDQTTATTLAPVASFPQHPPYPLRSLEDGTPYEAIFAPDGEVTLLPQCQFWGPEVECRFCDLNEVARHQGARAFSPKLCPPEQVAEAVGQMVAQGDWPPQERPLAITLTGGSLTEGLPSLAEEGFFLQHVDAIKERIGSRYPLLLEMQPKRAQVERLLYAHQVDARLSNLEVWDQRLFAALCPGKERFVGWEEWLRRLLDQVDIYGHANVLTNLVVGVELVEPSGFATPQEGIASTTTGFRFLIAHGVIPRPVHWRWERHAALAGQGQPPVAFFLELDRNWYEAWQAYQSGEPNGHILGPGRNRYPHSAAFDVGRGAELPSQP